MYLNRIPDKRNNRTLLVFQEKYRGKDGKPHSRTVEKIGFLEDLKAQYDDPIAHFREEARRRTAEKKAAENIIAVEIQKDGLLPFDESGEYDIRMRTGNAPIAKVIHSLGLDAFVDTRRHRLKCQYNLTNLLRLFAYQRILDPGSKIGDWRSRGKYYEKMGFTESQIYSGLQVLAGWKEDMLEHLNRMMAERYGRTYGYGYFDGTNIYYEIEDEDGFRNYGCSKENRRLPIVQMGLLLDSNGFPMSYDIYRGNTNDSQMLIPAMGKVKERFGFDHMIYVADSGFNTGDNTADIIAGHNGFVMSRSIRGTNVSKDFREEAIAPEGFIGFDASGNPVGSGEDAVFKYKILDRVGNLNVTSEVDGRKHAVRNMGRFCIVFWSQKYAERAKIDRMAAVEKAMVKSHSGSKDKVDNRHGSNKYLKTEIATTDGEILPDYDAFIRFDQEALDEDERLDGYYIIETNLAGKGWFGDDLPFRDGETSRWRKDWGMLQLARELEPMDIIDIYRGLWRIEDSFRVLKSFLSLRPAYVSTRASIEGHFLICFIALLIVRILEKEAGGDFSAEKIIESLRKAEIAEIADGKYINLYYDKVLQKLCVSLKLNLNQKAYTQNDLKMLFAQTRKDD